MGLLDRMQNGSESITAGNAGIIGRIHALRSEKESTAAGPAGEQPANFPGETETLSVDPAAAMRALLKDLRRLEHGGIETPSHLFALLHKHLAIQEGAILVPASSDSSEYVPLATSGLDATTRARLRLTQKTVQDFASRQTPYFVSGEAVDELKPYLSASLFRRLKRIALIPFLQGVRPVAVLVLFDSPVLNFDYNILNMLIAALGDSISEVLFQSRQRRINQTAEVLVLPGSALLDTVDRAQQSASEQEKAAAFIEMDLGAVAQQIGRDTPFLDQYRLAQDIEYVVANLFQDVGSLVKTGGHRLLLCTAGGSDFDPQLTIAAASDALSDMFGIPSIDLPYSLKSSDQLNFESQDTQTL